MERHEQLRISKLILQRLDDGTTVDAGGIRHDPTWVLGTEAGVPAHNVFGRNEPALHHYHNTFREALGMEPLELLEA